MPESTVTATFDLTAQSDSLISAARGGQAELGKLRDKYEENIRAVRDLSAAQQKLKQGGLAGGDSYKALGERLKSLRTESARLGSAYVELGGDFAAASPAKVAAEAAAKAEKIAEQARVSEQRAQDQAARKAERLAEQQANQAARAEEKRLAEVARTEEKASTERLAAAAVAAEQQKVLRAASAEDAAGDAIAKSAGRGSAALARIRHEYAANEEAIARLSSQQSKLAVGSSAYTQLGDRVAQLKTRNGALGNSLVKLGGNLEHASPKPLFAGFKSFNKILAQTGGPLAGVGAKANALTEAFGGSELGAALGLGISGLAALTVGAGLAAAAIAGFGIAMSAAAEKQSIQLRSLGALGKGFAYSKEQAEGFGAIIDNVAATSALSSDEVSKYAQSLLADGLRPQDLAPSLRAISQIASTQGDSYAAQFAKKVAASSKAKQSITKLTQDVNKKLGALANEAFGSVGSQFGKIKDNFTKGFESIDLSKFSGSLAQVAQLVDDLFKDGVGQAFVDGAAYGVSLLVLGFLKVESVILRVRLGLKAIGDFFSGDGGKKLEDFGRLFGVEAQRSRAPLRTVDVGTQLGVSLTPTLPKATTKEKVRDVNVEVHVHGDATKEDAAGIAHSTGASIAAILHGKNLAAGH